MCVLKRCLSRMAIFIFFPISAALAIPDNSIGGYSSSLQHPVGSLMSAGIKLCYVLGSTLLVVAAMRYSQHRNNSNQVRFSDVIFSLILGSILISLALFMQFVYVPSL